MAIISLDRMVRWALPLIVLAFFSVTAAGHGVFRDELYYFACGRRGSGRGRERQHPDPSGHCPHVGICPMPNVVCPVPPDGICPFDPED